MRKESISETFQRLMLIELREDFAEGNPLPEGASGFEVFDWYEKTVNAQSRYYQATKIDETGSCGSRMCIGTDNLIGDTAGAICQDIGVMVLKQEYVDQVLLTGENCLELMQKFVPAAQRVHDCMGMDSFEGLSTADAIAAEFDTKGSPVVSFLGEITSRKLDGYLNNNMIHKQRGVIMLSQNYPNLFRPGDFDIDLRSPQREGLRQMIIDRGEVRISYSPLPFTPFQFNEFLDYFTNEYRPNTIFPSLSQAGAASSSVYLSANNLS